MEVILTLLNTTLHELLVGDICVGRREGVLELVEALIEPCNGVLVLSLKEPVTSLSQVLVHFLLSIELELAGLKFGPCVPLQVGHVVLPVDVVQGCCKHRGLRGQHLTALDLLPQSIQGHLVCIGTSSFTLRVLHSCCNLVDLRTSSTEGLSQAEGTGTTGIETGLFSSNVRRGGDLYSFRTGRVPRINTRHNQSFEIT